MKPAAALLLALAAAATGATAAAPAEEWSRAFASASDTVLFLGADGALWRAPFHLATCETLWTPARGARLVRLRVSPDGRRFALLSRLVDEDTTRLWIGGPGRPEVRARYASLLPYRWDRLHFEPLLPTVADRGYRGARFLEVGARLWGRSSNTLEWTPDGRGVAFGFNDGVAFVAADSGPALEVSRALAMGLTVLEPAPLLLVDAVVLRQGLREGAWSLDRSVRSLALHDEAWYLLYPGSDRWRAFPASGLESGRIRVASEGTAWWVAAKAGEGAGTIRAVRVHDPTPTVEVEEREPVTWLGYDPATRSLLWTVGGTLKSRAEDGGPPDVRLATRSSIERVLNAGSGLRVLVTRDSAIVAGPGARESWSVPLAGLATPEAAYRSAGDELLLASPGRKGVPPSLAFARREPPALEPVPCPRVRNGRWAMAPGARYLALFPVTAKPPGTIHVFDLGARKWTEVANPGITGWEEISAR